MRYNKLVRDKIPEIIDAKGSKARVHKANEQEFIRELLKKLVEEASELEAEFIKSGEIDIMELADIDEVLDNIKAISGHTFEKVKAAKDLKRVNRGGFENRIILEEVHCE